MLRIPNNCCISLSDIWKIRGTSNGSISLPFGGFCNLNSFKQKSLMWRSPKWLILINHFRNYYLSVCIAKWSDRGRHSRTQIVVPSAHIMNKRFSNRFDNWLIGDHEKCDLLLFSGIFSIAFAVSELISVAKVMIYGWTKFVPLNEDQCAIWAEQNRRTKLECNFRCF